MSQETIILSTKRHHAQNTKNFKNEEILALLSAPHFEEIPTVLSQDPIQLIANFSETSYQLPSRRLPRSTSASGSVFIAFQTNPSEKSKNCSENFPKSKNKNEVKVYNTEITDAITPTSLFYRM